MLREDDDIGYFYNVYTDDPTEKNLQTIIRYRPQDKYDAIHKKVVLNIISGRTKHSSKPCAKCGISGVGLYKINKKFFCKECKKGVIIIGRN